MFQVKCRKITVRKHTLNLNLATSTQCTEIRTRYQCKKTQQGLLLKKMDLLAILHTDFPLHHNFSNFLQLILRLSVRTVWQFQLHSGYRGMSTLFLCCPVYIKASNGPIHRPKNPTKYLKNLYYLNFFLQYNRPERKFKIYYKILSGTI
jgi:hypothetical protein